MAKFEFLCSKDKVVVIKIGNSVYYLDIFDIWDIKIFDSEFKQLNIIAPEYWLPEATRGEASLSTLKACSLAYENGYNAGYSSKSKRYFKDFVKRLIKSLSDPETAERFVQLFWVELRPFDKIKEFVAKIVANPLIRERSARASRMTLDRYQPRAKYVGDKEYGDKIYLVTQEMESVTFDPFNELLDVLEIEDSDVPSLIQNINKVISFRDSK